MATVVPNRTGEALQRATENLMQMVLANRQYGLQVERLNLERRQQTEFERRSALERLMSFAPFLPEGKSISELPQIHESLKAVFPEFDPASPADLGGVVLNEQTLEDIMRPMLKAEFESLSPEARDQLMGRGLNRAILGVAASDTELQAQELQSSMMLDAWDTLRRDPVALEGIMRTQMGLQQPIRLNVGGRTVEFDTSQAASLSVQLMMHSEEMGFRRSQFSKEDMPDLAGELMKQMETAGQPISRSVAYSILNAYNRKVELANSGQLTPENDPMLPLVNSSNPDVSAAAQFFEGAGQIGEEALDRFLREAGPAGEQVLRGILVTRALGEANIPAEDIPDVTRSVLDILGGGQPGSEFPGFKTGFWQSRGFQISAPTAEDVQSMNNSGGTAPIVDREAVTLQAIKDVVSSGQATREQAVARFGEDVVSRALSGNSESAPSPSPSEPTRRRDSTTNAEIAEIRGTISNLENQLERYMAPVADRPEAQQQARANSQTARNLRARIERFRARLQEVEAR